MISKRYSDDEYYTSEKTAASFFKLVVKPSGILRHKTILMPFTSENTPLHLEAKKWHNNIVVFEGDKNLWENATTYADAAVIDNPPFSLSATIEKKYISKNIPFILFRSTVSYPKFILNSENAGVIYENSRKGVAFNWGFAYYINGDDYIKNNYPNLLDILKHHNILEKYVPIGFSFNLTNYGFKVKSVTFDEFVFPKNSNFHLYVSSGIYDESSKVYIDEKDGRVHLISYTK
ncbi:hypothetical protein HCA41_04670 [Listeria seeligeri]|nr:hypothetical protein [Listeria seeligeri]MBF2551568.1 hypothetical protein [Listeria seeligeri]